MSWFSAMGAMMVLVIIHYLWHIADNAYELRKLACLPRARKGVKMFDIGTITTILFLIGIAVGLPIGWLFIRSTALGLFVAGAPATFMANTFFHALDSSTIMAIAFFVFAGALISEAGLADRIVSFSYSLVGRLKGGLTGVGIVATLFLSALTGSSVPCIAALIPLLVPRLEKFGYKRVYTTALLCSSSYLGYLIPPSVPAMIYCLLAGQSVAALFIATVFPGLLLALGYGILNYFMVEKYTFGADENQSFPPPSRVGEGHPEHRPEGYPGAWGPVLILVGSTAEFSPLTRRGELPPSTACLSGGSSTRSLPTKGFTKHCQAQWAPSA